QEKSTKIARWPHPPAKRGGTTIAAARPAEAARRVATLSASACNPTLTKPETEGQRTRGSCTQEKNSKKKGHECSSLGKKDVSTKHVPSKKKLLKVDSHGKNLKQNLDLPGHIRYCAKQKPGAAKEHRKSFSYNSSDTKKDKNQTRKKHKKYKKYKNHSSPNKCDKTQTAGHSKNAQFLLI
ncbi:hypothetical protein MC885_007524, partial [Smutsia gigantea]